MTLHSSAGSAGAWNVQGEGGDWPSLADPRIPATRTTADERRIVLLDVLRRARGRRDAFELIGMLGLAPELYALAHDALPDRPRSELADDPIDDPASTAALEILLEVHGGLDEFAARSALSVLEVPR